MSKDKHSKPDDASGKKGDKDSSLADLAGSSVAEVKTATSPKTEVSPSASTATDVPSVSDLGLAPKDNLSGDSKDKEHKDHHKFSHSKKHFTRDDKHEKRGFSKPAPVANSSKESNTLLPATVTDNAIVDRALNEIEAPSIEATSLLQPNSYNANLTDVIRTKLAEDVDRAHTGWNPGDNAVVGNIVKFMNELCLRKNVYSFDMIKSADMRRHIAYYTPRERQREVDIANVNVNTGASLPGTSNSGYPFSSRYGNSMVWRPFQPQMYDEIKQFPLQGFVIKPSNTFFPANGTNYSNILTTILHTVAEHLPAFLNPQANRAYVLPMPGFNFIPRDTDVNQGRVIGELHDYRNVVNRLKILDGPWGTCFRQEAETVLNGRWQLPAIIETINGEIPLLNTEFSNEYVFEQHPLLTQWTEDILDCGNAIDRGIEPTDYMSYPDLNAETYLFDMHHIYLKLLHNVQDRVYTPLTGQLAGVVMDEQAVWHSLIALEQMGTFFRILLHSIQVTWGYGGYVARKLGCLCYNDMAMRIMSPTRKAPLTGFLAFVADIIKDLPYNKYVVDNFKIWFDATTQTNANAYDENNSTLSIRAIFSSIYNLIGWDGHANSHNTFPHLNVPESTSISHIYSILHPHDTNETTLHSLFDGTNASRFGMNVLSNITQSAIFVPHGCPLGDFLYQFSDTLFTNRAPRILERGNSNILNAVQGHVTNSLTMMLDPLNLTGFAFNFFNDFNSINRMRAWLSSWKNLVRNYNEQLRASGVSNGSFYYDEKPQGLFDINAFYANEAVVIPSFKQHIVSYIQQSPRLAGRVNNDTAQGANTINIGTAQDPIQKEICALWVTGHRPMQQATNQPTQNFFAGVLQATVLGENYMAENHGNLPRVGFRYSSRTQPLDFGTIGDAMYNVATAWYTTNQSFYQRYHDKVGLATLDAFADAVDGGRHTYERMMARWKSGSFMAEPYEWLNNIGTPWLDRYMVKHWWYPSIWNIPYYPRCALAGCFGTELVPCYDYRPATDIGEDDSFTPHQLLGTDYVEHYYASGRETGDIINAAVAISATRVLYGCYNNDAISPDQWAHNANITGGFNFNGLLLTRQNKVSIFTVYNADTMGILTCPRTDQNAAGHWVSEILTDDDGVPEWVYTLQFEQIFGLPCCTLSAVNGFGSGAGGTIPYIDVYTYNLGLKSFISGSDLDLSVSFANLAAICGKLRAMVSESECYPSSDGYGHDLTAHPEDQKPYENRGAAVPDYATAMNLVMDKD